jgi:hypothetical protein
MTVSGSKSSCGMKVILSSRSMVDRRHINNRSMKRRTSKSRGEELRQYYDEEEIVALTSGG